MKRTFVYKLKPNATQETGLQRYLDVTRTVYNAALEQRIAAHRMGGRRSWPDQCQEIKELRVAGLLEGCHVHTVQGALRRLDRAYDTFFQRQAAGRRGGFPRFRGARHWRSFVFQEYGNGCEIRDGRLRVAGVGSIRLRQHRPLRGKPVNATIIRKPDGWYVLIASDLGDAPPVRSGNRVVGVDLGLEAYATLSDGERIENPRHLRSAERKLRAEYRALSRKRRGSRRYEKQRQRLAVAHLRVARTRRDFHFKLALDLVRRFDRIAVEDLAVAAMRGAGGVWKRGLNRSMADAAWGQFVSILEAKAEEHGVEVVRVDPRYTSQACSECGVVARKALSERRHVCGCGADLHRDHNAAINIKNRAWVVPVVEVA